MNPRLRGWLLAGTAAAAAVWMSWLAAQGSYTLPALVAAVTLAAILVRLTRLPADVILLGLLLIGYIVGNRGFAQLMPLPGLPLFPAEFGLGVGLAWLVIQSALRRKLPWRRDLLNRVLFVWLVLGTARVAIDVRHYGFLAVRDYATVYYAGFFFLAQQYAGDPRARRYLASCAGLAAVALLPVFLLFQQFPLFFLFHLTFRGVPLIYLKGDLVYTFLAAGSVMIFHAVRGPHRCWGWPLATALLLAVGTGDSRASLVGAGVAMVWLALGRRWAFPAIQVGATALALVIVGALAYSRVSSSAERQLRALGDRVASIADVRGTFAYSSAEELDKSDNNQFRLVWWRTVVQQTWDGAPVFGLGFGTDLAASFIQEYDPDMGEDFSARSPHSIIVGTFGRMGAVGLATLLAIVAAMAGRTWRALRDRATDPTAVGLWCAVWVIFTSACFGVVLEGPMGAVVFWSLLGLASGMEAAGASEKVAGGQAPAPSGNEAAAAAGRG